MIATITFEIFSELEPRPTKEALLSAFQAACEGHWTINGVRLEKCLDVKLKLDEPNELNEPPGQHTLHPEHDADILAWMRRTRAFSPERNFSAGTLAVSARQYFHSRNSPRSDAQYLKLAQRALAEPIEEA